HDVLVVAAAGNSGNSRPDYPARYSANLGNVLSVGAYSSSSAVAGFSNRVGSSNAVQIDAPGVSVYSTVANNRYAIYSGTSMASPQAAGVAALALSANPNLTASQLRSILVSGATTSVRSSDARGGVNAARTVASAAALSSSSASASASSSASSVVAIGAANAASSRGTADSIHARLRRLGSSLFSSNTEVASRARSNRVSHNGVTPDRAAYFAAISNDGAHHVQNGSVLAVDALFAAIPMWNRDFG
ncbi:MAG: S8 family serine peptidase, partial [Planctomycetales bacterium]|nr:S8 family serine peptidase [Planctomycetales bacterium]